MLFTLDYVMKLQVGVESSSVLLCQLYFPELYHPPFQMNLNLVRIIVDVPVPCPFLPKIYKTEEIIAPIFFNFEKNISDGLIKI